ncbi:MAG: DUF892 family protein [Gemmatimonadetes bacterium]|nr:DUF892 family protein [Gemmatimonadota bacterium]
MHGESNRRQPTEADINSRDATNRKDQEELLLAYLRELHDAERRLVDVLPRFADAAQDSALREGLRRRFREGVERTTALAALLRDLGQEARGTECWVVRVLVHDAEARIIDTPRGRRDLVVMASELRLREYLGALRATTRTLAAGLGRVKIASVLRPRKRDRKPGAEGLINWNEEKSA